MWGFMFQLFFLIIEAIKMKEIRCLGKVSISTCITRCEKAIYSPYAMDENKWGKLCIE